MSSNDSDFPTNPVIVFGAFDRHNFGDLLFPHILQAVTGSPDVLHAGLVARSLKNVGGHDVHAIADLAGRYRDRPVRIVHAGGELLTCGAWEAAVMSLPPDEARAQVRHLEDDAQRRLAWAQERLGLETFAPYVVGRSLFPRADAIVHNAIGGAELDAVAAAMRVEVREKLASADCVSVRDRRTLAHLHSLGLSAQLVPDPAVMVAELFHDRLRAHALSGEVLQCRQAFPNGYLAVQFSTDFCDEATLDTLATGLDQFARHSGCGIVLFRAGAAPWHDDIDAYRLLAARMRSNAVRIMSSLHLWDICALIARCSAYVGSSLHGRIVATAHALPCITLCRSDTGSGCAKHAAYTETWDGNRQHAPVEPAMLCEAMLATMQIAKIGREGRQAAAAALAARYRAHAETLRMRLGGLSSASPIR